jgi:hypothetical protein
MVNELSIQNHLTSCRANIERSANLHVEFWSQLSEDQPDLGKLSDLGFKISLVNQAVEEQWSKLLRINSNMPSMMRLFAKYLTEVLNDREGGTAILRKQIDLASRNQHKRSASLIDMSTESRSTIFISAEDDSFGLITNLNLQAAGALGYNKMEVLNRNVKLVMPLMYAKYHDFFLENYLSTLEPRILNTERMLPSKTKQDYVNPLQVEVRHVPSLIHGLQFVAQFKFFKVLAQVCYLIIDTDGKVENISTQCISLLHIDIKKLQKKVLKILYDCVGRGGS